MWLSGIVAALMLPGVVVWALLTQPIENQVAAILVSAFLLVFFGFLIFRKTWLDTERGLVVRVIAGAWKRPVAWADASVIRVQGNNGGQALLEVRGQGRRTSTYLPLVAVDLGGDRSQPPEFLRLLADQIERWAPHREAVVKQLRAQADHVAAGGSIRESPVALTHIAHSVRGR